jgi:CBS domain-containing protein
VQVRDGMSHEVLTVGPGHTLREAARLMSERGIGSAVVIDPDEPGPGILTERDVLEAVGAGPTSSSPSRAGRSSRRPRRWPRAASAT